MVRFVARGDSSRLGEFHDVQNHPNSGLVMQPRSLPFASLNFGIKSSEHDSNGTNGHKVIEKRTGIEFPYEFCFRRSFGRCPQITGAGARTKRIAGIKSLDIYALALYVDKKELKNNLGRKFGRRLPEQLANDQDLFDELVKAQNVEKSLVIKITSGLVKRGNFLVALNERLSPPLKRLGQDEVIKSFESQFDSVSFRKGLEISFNINGGRLTTKADGKEIGSFQNKHLSNTLLDIYIGKDPVSPGAKQEFGHGLASMIIQ